MSAAHVSVVYDTYYDTFARQLAAGVALSKTTFAFASYHQQRGGVKKRKGGKAPTHSMATYVRTLGKSGGKEDSVASMAAAAALVWRPETVGAAVAELVMLGRAKLLRTRRNY